MILGRLGGGPLPAAGIETFADDPKATVRLMEAAGRTYSHYALVEEHRNREKRQQLDELREQVKASSVWVVSSAEELAVFERRGPRRAVAHPAGKRITERQHRKCPGQAVFIDPDRIQVVAI